MVGVLDKPFLLLQEYYQESGVRWALLLTVIICVSTAPKRGKVPFSQY